MKNHARHLLLSLVISFALLPWAALAQNEDPAEAGQAAELKKLLQQGLFEEEATREFDKAAENYEKLLEEFESHRQLAATALYRLAEVRRKQNRNKDAIALYQKFITEFPDHDPLSRLCRENLVALGAPTETGGEAPASQRTDGESVKIRELKLIAEESPDLLTAGNHLGNAAKAGHLRVVTFLLDSGLSPNSESALSQAAAAGHLAICKLLLERGAKVNGTPDSSSPLQNALYLNREAIVSLLLARGADPNHPKDDNEKPLLIAASNKSNAMAKLLLERGADPDFVSSNKADEENNKGIRPRGFIGAALHEALYSGNLELADLLLDHKANVNVLIPGTHVTPLHIAAKLGDKGLIRRILDAGAKIGAKTTSYGVSYRRSNSSSTSVINMPGGLTPLYYAMDHESPEIVKQLMSAGASFHDSPSLPPAAAGAGLPFAKLALDEGISPDYTGGQGITLLHLAVGRAHLDLVQELVDRGAKVDLVADDGQTPLTEAFERESSYYFLAESDPRREAIRGIIRLLIEHGADPLHELKGRPMCLTSDKTDLRMKSAREVWYPALMKRNQDKVTIAAPDAPRTWDLAIARSDSPRGSFALTLLGWKPQNIRVNFREVGSRSSSRATLVGWDRCTLFRKQPKGDGLDEIEVDLSNPKTFPELKGGDVLEFRIPESRGIFEINGISMGSTTEWPPSVSAALNSGIEFDLNVKMKGAPGKLTLSGGVRVFDPTSKRAPIAHAEELVRLLGGEHPRFLNAILRVKRPGWGDIEAVSGTRAARIELKPGDTLEVLPNPESSREQQWNDRWRRVTLVSPGLPFAKSIRLSDASPTLIQFIVAAYPPLAPHAVEGYSDNWEEFLFSVTDGYFRVVLPHPDFSKVRVRRLEGKGPNVAEEIIEVDLAKAIESATDSEEARAADLELVPGDIVELPVLQGAKKPWAGFDVKTSTFLRKALTYRVNVFEKDGEHQPVILQYDPPKFVETDAGIVLVRRSEESIHQTDVSSLMKELGWENYSGLNFTINRGEGEEKEAIVGAQSYNYYLRDMDGFQIQSLTIRPTPVSRIPSPPATARPSSSSPRRRIVLPQPSSR